MVASSVLVVVASLVRAVTRAFSFLGVIYWSVLPTSLCGYFRDLLCRHFLENGGSAGVKLRGGHAGSSAWLSDFGSGVVGLAMTSRVSSRAFVVRSMMPSSMVGDGDGVHLTLSKSCWRQLFWVVGLLRSFSSPDVGGVCIEKLLSSGDFLDRSVGFVCHRVRETGSGRICDRAPSGGVGP